MRLYAALLLVLVLASCNSTKKQQKTELKPIDWAIKFADATMERSDSLIYYHRDKPKYEYDYAFLGSAINKLGKFDPKYTRYMKDYIDYFVSDDGKEIGGYSLKSYNIDRVRPGLNMLELYSQTGEEKYIVAAKQLVSQMETHPRTNSGGYWHKKIYPYQMWLDGIYMASPFLARYAHDFNQPKWYDEVVFQITEIYKHTKDDSTGLVYHAWDESKAQRWSNPETGKSKHFWSRGTGWYMMALVDVLEYLPEDHPGREKLIGILQDLSASLLKVQDKESGLWYQVMEMGGRERNYLEASGSAMFIYTFAKGANNGYLDEKYLQIAQNSFDGMLKTLVKTDESGLPVLTQTVGGCGLGGNPYREADYNYYVTETKVDNDQKGVAPFIMAAIELQKAKDAEKE